MTETFIICIIGGYLLGSVPFGLVVTRLAGLGDIRKIGSGNIGATNVLRTGRKDLALLTVLLDASKAGFAAWLALRFVPAEDMFFAGIFTSTNLVAALYAGTAAIIGHNFPVWLKFKGGKGVATLVGAVLGIHPITVLLCFGIWFIVLMITHYVSLSSMIAGCCFPVFVLLSPKINHSVPLVVFSFVIAALLIWTHRKNIDRLKKGTESKIYIWRPVASRRRNDPDK